jgi:hypothetical protein
VQQVSAADTHSADLNQQKISACMGQSPVRRHSIDIHQTSVFVVCTQPVATDLDHVGVQAQRSNPLHDGLSVQVAMTGLRGWRLPAAPALASAAALLVVGALPGWGRTPSEVPFPSPESLRQVQLAALACARENTSEACNQARKLGDPFMDHPRLPANCKDLIWQMLAKSQPASMNSFSRRQAISDPAEKLLLVCRSSEKPEAAETPAAKPSAGGINLGGGQR